MCCSVLRCVAMCCSVLRCVVVCLCVGCRYQICRHIHICGHIGRHKLKDIGVELGSAKIVYRHINSGVWGVQGGVES